MDKKLLPLEVALIDEYLRNKRHIQVEMEYMARESQGYLSWKKKGNKSYCYLQWREGKKIKSRYIKKEDEKEISDSIFRRKRNEKNIKIFKAEMKMIEKIISAEKIAEYVKRNGDYS